MILSLKAGGVGLNRMANHVFHFDRWWNPAGNKPLITFALVKLAMSRHKFVCTGTLENHKMIESKKAG